MRPAASHQHRKRLDYHVWLDLPVGLTSPRATPDGPERAIVFTGHPGPSEPEHPASATQPGWLALIRIRNQGPAPVSGPDLTALLAYTFPGREVLAAWVPAEPAAGNERRAASRQTARAPHTGDAAPDPADDGPGRVGYGPTLRPKDTRTIAVILSGTPAAGLDGTLARGRLTSRSRR